MTTSRPEQAPPGLFVGDYELLTRLGEGGMGVVHLARKPGGERVALKVLRPHIVGDDEARRRLAREVSSLTRVKSRRVAEILDADPWGEIPFVATRYVPGLSLHDHIHEEGPLEGDDLVWFATCLAEALAAVHGVGVLHRDIKPSNILMEGRTPILIDFGLARVADDPKLTHTGWLLGTPGYLAPEILFGEDASTASDVHSWAATVAFAGTGRAPFGRGPSMAIMDRVRRGEHDLSDLDPSIRRAVTDALDPEPRNRPTLDELREWLSTRGPHTAAAPADDPFTMPMAVAAMAGTTAPTEVAEPALRPESPRDSGPSEPPGWAARETAPQRQSTRVLPDGSTQTIGSDEAAPAPPARPVGGFEKLRRGILVLAGIGVVGAAVALAPYVAIAVLTLLVWILRSGSMAASSAGARRQLRGAKWYDGVQVLLAAPWHAVASIPGALLLVLWSIGLGLAAALLCFAVGASMLVSLAIIGVVLGGAMWWGPGSRRLRGPVHRLSHPISARPLLWFFAAVATLAVASGLAATALAQGTDWAPAAERPFADMSLPSWLQP
ncbi:MULTISPECIES: serine/threonine-protein kinase [Nocardioides]|uniref:serine/threonine-protein kinase n=1 Tax=Nocardioides TaxID=1839 RepID=UPI0003310E3D|nr:MULTISPECIES: serine/threonine-protein kinase [Nocardioides]EON23153.1 protein kinase [Nocardioides sp. CF8]